MKDLLSGFAGSRPRNSASGISGLLLASGVPFDQALIQGSAIASQQANAEAYEQQVRAHRQQALQEQEAMQMKNARREGLAQLLRNNPDLPPNELAAYLFESGENVPADIINNISPRGRKAETFTGADNVRYEQFIDPDTGQLSARALPGQAEKQKPKISTAEARINAMKLKELAGDARTGQTEVRILDDIAKAFEEFDEATGNFTGAGSLASKFSNKATDNLVYNEKAQAAKQKIDKLNSQLFQNRIRGAGARATDSFKAEVKKGLPSVELTKDARRDILETKLRENLESQARSKFFSEWYKKNGKDTASAEDAFIAFIQEAPLVDQNNRPNTDLIKQIPSIVDQFLAGEPAGNNIAFDEQEDIARDVMEAPIGDEDTINFDDYSLEELLRARQRKAKR